eukprot:CAMPEP_0172544654 /NCGR_PEP_ID=MMETSP1067-20121228/14752_1 /TAXON_ID=265564 ORGANISM="Thalassiosira punctigera, Strain Tpunct2005C2" /NCGR_SAMPLE_ID=MMETSP1067 /ASSEMBLY_ACC=CAM_ASM_000444 /LENGTH=694 /DNA_ID=CAMNT_0013331247 /DNA_START=139 /DNA_END=2219 /DNA_ORIENTATION=-
MKIFSSSLTHFSERLSLLLLLAFVAFGSDGTANAENVFSFKGNDVATETNEHVLYSNPQFFALPEQKSAGDGDDEPPDAVAAVGLLFNLRSKLADDDATIRVTGFEFYTSLSGTVFYDLSSREGKYYDEGQGARGGPGIGTWTSFDSRTGLADGAGRCDRISEHYGSAPLEPQITNRAPESTITEVCPLTIIPEEEFVAPYAPWTLGANSTRSFYITMASQHLLVSPGAPSSDFDAIVTASTPDLDLYEGVATRTYPFHGIRTDYYHPEPKGFIGKIHYRVEEREGAFLPTKKPSSPRPNPDETNSTETYPGEPTAAPQTPDSYATLPPTLAPTTSSPTAKPTKRCRPGRPCLSPPIPVTATPTASPLISSSLSTTVEMMVYLENLEAARVMEEREEKEYLEVMANFLQQNQNLRKNGVVVTRVKIFHHNLLEEENKKRKNGRELKAGSKVGSSVSEKKAKDRVRNNGKGGFGSFKYENTQNSFLYNYNTKSLYTPKIHPAIYVMTKVEVMTKLPRNVAAFFLWEELRDNEMFLMKRFKEQSFFVSYFRELTSITSEVVRGLSRPPTRAPTKEAASGVDGAKGEGEEVRSRGNTWSYVGVAIGFIWLFLMLCGFKEIIKFRHKGKEKKELKRQQMTSARSERFDTRRTLSSFSSIRHMAFRRRSLGSKGKTNEGRGGPELTSPRGDGSSGAGDS